MCVYGVSDRCKEYLLVPSLLVHGTGVRRIYDSHELIRDVVKR